MRYRGVSRPSRPDRRPCWIAQNRNPRIFKSGFPTKLAAAEWLCAALRVPLQSLVVSGDRVRKVVSKVATSRFQGVTPHWRSSSRHGPPRWQARLGTTKLGEFSSEQAAALCVAKAQKVSKPRFRMSLGSLSRKNARDIFAAAYKVFRDYVPQDLQVLHTHEETFKVALRQARILKVNVDCAGPSVSYAFVLDIRTVRHSLSVRNLLCGWSVFISSTGPGGMLL
jgi:hypothetical protein